MFRATGWTIGVLCCIGMVQAQLKLPNVIDSNMVLQREPLAARLWGWDTSGSAIRILLDGEEVAHTTATTNGTWAVDLPQHKASTDHTIVIEDGATNFTLTNIAFGDVYLCSGAFSRL